MLRGWKLNPTVAFRSGAFGRLLGLGKVFRVKPMIELLVAL
jgi:hypothetical protein